MSQPLSDHPTDALAEFEHALSSGDTARAVAVVDRALDRGSSAIAVLCDIITPAQHRVGQSWQSGRWSVAQEHIATGVSVAATEALARHVQKLPLTRGSIIVECAEREWHALAALSVSVALRERGWNVLFLGAGTPVERLFSYLHQVGPDAVAISCSVAGGLPGTRKAIESATMAGVPVLLGGNALGTDEVRARALGTVAWAPSLPVALDVVERLPSTVEPIGPLPGEPLREQLTLNSEHYRLAARIASRWAPLSDTETFDLTVDSDLAMIRRGCVDHPLRVLQGALVTGDGRLVAEAAEWVRTVLTARSVPIAEVTALRAEILGAVESLPLTHSLVERYWPVGEPARGG